MLPKQRDELLARILRELPLGSLSQDEAQAWIGDPLFETHLAEALIANMPKTGNDSLVLGCSRIFDSCKLEMDDRDSCKIDLRHHDARIPDSRLLSLPTLIDFSLASVYRCFQPSQLQGPLHGWAFVGMAMTRPVLPLGLDHFLALALDYQFKLRESVLWKIFLSSQVRDLYFLGQTTSTTGAVYMMGAHLDSSTDKDDCEVAFNASCLDSSYDVNQVYYLGIDSERITKRTSHYKRGPGLEHIAVSNSNTP